MGPGRALAVGFEGTRVPDDLVALAEHAGLGGVVLFARNCPNLETVLALTAAARKLGPDVLVLVDHEGGRVHRLPPPFTRSPPAASRSSRPCSPKGWFPSPSTSRGTDAPRSTRISPCRTSTRPSTSWSAGISFHSAPPSEPAARR